MNKMQKEIDYSAGQILKQIANNNPLIYKGLFKTVFTSIKELQQKEELSDYFDESIEGYI